MGSIEPRDNHKIYLILTFILESVEIVATSALGSFLECGSFDLTHARFMIASLGHEEELLGEMVALTRPGGIVALQEPDAGSWNCYPLRPAFRRLVSAIQDATVESGGDFNAGRRTYGLLRRAGLVEVRARAAVIASDGTRHPFRSAVLHMANALRKTILEADILSQPELGEEAFLIRGLHGLHGLEIAAPDESERASVGG